MPLNGCTRRRIRKIMQAKRALFRHKYDVKYGPIHTVGPIEKMDFPEVEECPKLPVKQQVDAGGVGVLQPLSDEMTDLNETSEMSDGVLIEAHKIQITQVFIINHIHNLETFSKRGIVKNFREIL